MPSSVKLQVLCFSSRSKSFTDPYGTKTLNKKIINAQKNFKADLIVLGHADNVTVDTINNV